MRGQTPLPRRRPGLKPTAETETVAESLASKGVFVVASTEHFRQRALVPRKLDGDSKGRQHCLRVLEANIAPVPQPGTEKKQATNGNAKILHKGLANQILKYTKTDNTRPRGASPGNAWLF